MGFLANLIAKVLATRRGVEFTYLSYKYSSIFPSHTISFVSSSTATYSSFVVESSETYCLCDLETNAYPRLMIYLEVDTPFALSQTMFELEYPIGLNSSTLEYP
jgi:hypothetical protein